MKDELAQRADAPRTAGALTAEKAADHTPELSARQIECLRWIGNNINTRSRWMDKNGKSPRHMTKGWDFIEMSGPDGSIRIAAADMKAISGLIGPSGDPRSNFGLTDAGRAALAKATTPPTKFEAGAVGGNPPRSTLQSKLKASRQ